jgi:hypothetical protein
MSTAIQDRPRPPQTSLPVVPSSRRYNWRLAFLLYAYQFTLVILIHLCLAAVAGRWPDYSPERLSPILLTIFLCSLAGGFGASNEKCGGLFYATVWPFWLVFVYDAPPTSFLPILAGSTILAGLLSAIVRDPGSPSLPQDQPPHTT